MKHSFHTGGAWIAILIYSIILGIGECDKQKTKLERIDVINPINQEPNVQDYDRRNP